MPFIKRGFLTTLLLALLAWGLPSELVHAVTITSPWQLVQASNSGPTALGPMFLMTNGQVLVQSKGKSDWWLYTPTSSGSYQNGTWAQTGSMQNGYMPTAYASAVLPDGKLLVLGGEYNGSATIVETNQGSLYDPATGTWSEFAPPNVGGTCFQTIGDAPSTVLADGSFLLGHGLCTAIFHESTLTWTSTGTGKFDAFSEEGLTLLPNNNVLVVDAASHPKLANPPPGGSPGKSTHTEIYNAISGEWASGGQTPTPIEASGSEIGPAALMPSGMVFAEGADGANALYSTSTKTWSAGPAMPVVGGVQTMAADACSAVLPGGDVLFDVSPIGVPPLSFYLFNGTSISSVPTAPVKSSGVNSEPCFLLVLPSGQVLANVAGKFELYTDPSSPQDSWRPVVTSLASSIVAGTSYSASGNQLNGLNQGSYYGDDLQNATNYPLVQITNTQTGHVSYAKTYGFTSMSVTPNQPSSFQFIVPATTDNGASTILVIANGIASLPVKANISGGVFVAAPTTTTIKKTVLVTITCVKGKLVKKVTAAKPICPAGYTKK